MQKKRKVKKKKKTKTKKNKRSSSKKKSSSRKQSKRSSLSEQKHHKKAGHAQITRRGSFDASKTHTASFVVKKKSKRKDRLRISDLVKNNLGIPPHMDQVVFLHKGADYYDWLADNTVSFLNEAVIIYSSIMEFCTKETCPVMSAGPKIQYKWLEGKNVRTAKPITLCAPEYVDKFLSWAQTNLGDEKVLPLSVGKKFPKTLPGIIRNVFKHVFRIYAHIYLNHLRNIIALGNDDYVNSSFKHFIHFANHFQLMEIQDYTPLKDLIKAIMDPAMEVGSDEGSDIDEPEYEEKEPEPEPEPEAEVEAEVEAEAEAEEEKAAPKQEIDPELLVDSDISDLDDIDITNLSDLEDDDDDDILDD